MTRWVGRLRHAEEPEEAKIDLTDELGRIRNENARLKQERDILKKGSQ